MLKRIKKEETDAVEKTKEHLAEYAEKGYRTLCFAYRPLKASFYKKWEEKYSNAITAVPKDERLIAELESEVESDMTLLGATAIEDKLQIVCF